MWLTPLETSRHDVIIHPDGQDLSEAVNNIAKVGVCIMTECAKVLLKGDAQKVSVLTLARAMR